jgi:hypothetical protein
MATNIVQWDVGYQRLTLEQKAAFDAAPEPVQLWQWSVHEICHHFNLPLRFVNGVPARHRYRIYINGRGVATVDLTGLVFLHQAMLRRRR